MEPLIVALPDFCTSGIALLSFLTLLYFLASDLPGYNKKRIYPIKRRRKLSHRVCPWWLGYLLASPLRRLLQDPEAIMRTYVREGMSVLDVGCGMGFFSLPLAELVGATGKVVCVDLQEKMIKGLIRRAEKAGLSGRIDARVADQNSLTLSDIAGKIDFALLFALVHEVPDKERLFSEVYAAMKRTGKLLLAEPAGHVSKAEFKKTVSHAQSAGFEVLQQPQIRRSHAVLLQIGQIVANKTAF
jgi:ubiquinone/menaquinone biosynthesis C-methylase UbiE